MYDVHLGIIGKCVAYFLLVLIEPFCQLIRQRRYEWISAQNRQFCSNSCRCAQTFTNKESRPNHIFHITMLN